MYRHWQQLNEEDRKAVLEITSALNGLPQIAVEKDWWVTMTLKALSMTRCFPLMSFKGGTSLSKGWNFEQNSLPFARLLERIAELQSRIRELASTK